MCKVLKISRSTYYAYTEKPQKEDALRDLVEKLFTENQHVYGTHKWKVEWKKFGYIVSRRRIAKMLRCRGFVSAYTVTKYRVHTTSVNEDIVSSIAQRQLNQKMKIEVIARDWTYIWVENDWNDSCILLNWYNREIAGYSCGKHKDAQLVYKAFISVKIDLGQLCVLHTDCGSEFKNYLIDDLLTTFNIRRSLRAKGCPYDNAVAEAQFKSIKTEPIRFRRFETLEHWHTESMAYVYWFHH